MGLDMYLYKMPRYRGTTAKEVSNIESYLEWLEKKEAGNEYANCSLEEWCGVSEDKLPSQRVIDFYKKHYDTKYWNWDTEHLYGHKMIMQQVADWRKANQIHEWFVENIQDGEDDCCFHREVTESDLEELLDVCKTVLESCVLVDGKIQIGYTFDESGNKVYQYINGKYIADSSIAEELLPTQSGFFFGGTAYDEWYVDDIKDTIQMIEKILKETDFDIYAIYYVSSW
jgi:hypothetical protein